MSSGGPSRTELERLVQEGGLENGAATASAELLVAFLGSVPDFLVLTALDDTVLFVNRARAGSRPIDVIGHKITEYSAPADRPQLERALSHVKRTGEGASFEHLGRYTDGTEHTFWTRVAPVLVGERAVALAITATELTAQKQLEAEARASEEKVRVTVAATGMGLWTWDAIDDSVSWDGVMCAIWGVTPGTVPANYREYIDLIHPEDRARVTGIVAEALRTGVYPEIEHRILRRDGSTRRVLARASVVRDASGKVERMVGGAIDVTDQRELEERARQAQKIEAVGQLSAGVAHNFNNMLMAMLPNIELAMRRSAPDEVALLADAHAAGMRAAELVRQLMTFAGRAHTSEKRADDVNALVERTVAMCRRAFDREIELELRLSRQAEVVIADAVQLEQVLLNLLINARDAVGAADRDEGKRVQVDVARSASHANAPPRDAGYVCIRVSDNGVGMSEATRERMYEPFFTTKRVGRGTGLGLSTARSIVAEHGGAIECDSVEGVGSTFSVFLPLVGGEPSRSSPSPSPSPEVGPSEASESREILLVDDEAPVRHAVALTLREAGFVVHLAASGAEALSLVRGTELAGRLSLVLLDMSMPGMSGIDTRRKLGSIAPELPIAYFSGYPLNDGGDVAGVIQKPISAEELIRAVREILTSVGTRAPRSS